MGKRGIAGGIVFLVFDRSALFKELDEDSLFWGNKNERPANAATITDRTGVSAISESTATEAGQSIGEDAFRGGILDNKTNQKAYYHDQIPPFDVKLVAASERGHGAIMEILGMEILNCASGISVDDITTDESCTWIGVNIIPWHNQTYVDPKDGTSTVDNSYGKENSKDGNQYTFAR